jgi:hypothetical protein
MRRAKKPKSRIRRRPSKANNRTTRLLQARRKGPLHRSMRSPQPNSTSGVRHHLPLEQTTLLGQLLSRPQCRGNAFSSLRHLQYSGNAFSSLRHLQYSANAFSNLRLHGCQTQRHRSPARERPHRLPTSPPPHNTNELRLSSSALHNIGNASISRFVSVNSRQL